MSNTNSVKYTTILPKSCLDELRILADKMIISSVSQGIRLAVEDFVAAQKQYIYESSLREAAADGTFIKRTLDTQNDFALVDEVGNYQW